MTLFKTVSKLKDLAEKDGRDNYKGKFTGETQHVNSRLNNGRKKLEVDPNYFLYKNHIKKKKKKKKRKRKTRQYNLGTRQELLEVLCLTIVIRKNILWKCGP